MNVIFLDYDGVVNKAMWNEDGTKCCFNFPEDGKVNDFQAVKWIEQFCKEYNYSIVVSSSWRSEPNYKECLYNGGLSRNIEIIGCTPYLGFGFIREDEIAFYLKDHPEIDNYIIVDDVDEFPNMQEHFIKTEESRGFGWPEKDKAIQIHNSLLRGMTQKDYKKLFNTDFKHYSI